MREALVQHAEHQIDRDQRGENQQRLRAGGSRERLRIASELRLDDVGQAHVQYRALHVRSRGFQRDAFLQPERDGDGGKLALMVDHQRRDRTFEVRDVRERHLHTTAAGNVDVRQVVRVALILRIDLEDDAILVALGIDRGNLALRIRVGERGVDILHADAIARGSRAVDRDIELKAALLAVG